MKTRPRARRRAELARIALYRNISAGRAAPESVTVVLPFTELWHNTTAGGGYDWVIRGNSVYDPDYALSADSALGESKWANVYNRYSVSASAIKVTVINQDADDPVNVTVLAATFPESFAYANMDASSHYPGAVSLVVDPEDGSKVLQNSAKTIDLFQVKDLDSVNFFSKFDTNPSTCWYWHILTSNLSTNALDCQMKVEVFYRTTMYDPQVYTQ